MSSDPTTVPARPLTFRRYKDGDHGHRPWQEEIFDADHSHKCPTYIQSTPPCQGACPSGEDIRGYLNIVRGIEKPPAGMPWQEHAWRRLTEANPLPGIMGRVCPAPCESGCNRNQVDDFVGINSVEHFLGEWAIEHRLAFAKPQVRSGRKVAVVGGGPAGLSAAYQLARRGHDVTLFDERAELGGMMRYGIPGFRTPRRVLDAEIQRILDLGVATRMTCRIGTDITLEQLRADFDAVFLGLGAQSGRALPVPGAQAPNVVTATAFLQAFNEGRLQHVGRRVVVVGGGDTSIDVATVARRLGHIDTEREADRPELAMAADAGFAAHDAALLSRRQGAEVTLTSVFAVERMQAGRHEVEHALAEGIAIRGGLAPVAVVCDAAGRATALRVTRCEARLVSGRLEIWPIEGTREDIPADLIVSAIGQAVDLTGLQALDNGRGAVAADRNYQVLARTGGQAPQVQAGLFCGGDVIRPHLLTTAIGHGAIAAEGIDRFLKGEPQDKRPKIDVHSFDLLRKLAESGKPAGRVEGPLRGTDTAAGVVHNFDNRSDRYIIPHTEQFLGHFTWTERQRRRVTTLTAEQALNNFEERMLPLLEAQVQAEAKRCMSCGLCFECDNCVVYCPQTAVFKVKKGQATTGRYVDTDYTRCVGCHICSDVCPTGYIQMGLGE